ncbi:MAG TPA: type II toxin-antitoxin system VapC family toxin [Thermomicrobiales bacterium]|nr:type II toxin-antitoxin system VapC family toxin [Thermomicrobiales bacterium]
MRYLLDTNIVSEFRLPTPATEVIAFIGAVDPASAFLSVVTVMEVHRGVAALPVGKRRSEIEQWLVNDLLPEFDGRILDIDQSTARMCGYLLGQRKLESTIRRSMDFWLAATALQYDLAIVTRNERDFRDLGVEVVNPWVSRPPRPVAAAPVEPVVNTVARLVCPGEFGYDVPFVPVDQ